MADPRDPGAVQRIAERDRRYREALLEAPPVDLDPATRAQAVAACGLCDGDGYRNGRVCDHQDHEPAAKRGIAKCREVLAAKQLRLDQENRS